MRTNHVGLFNVLIGIFLRPTCTVCRKKNFFIRNNSSEQGQTLSAQHAAESMNSIPTKSYVKNKSSTLSSEIHLRGRNPISSNAEAYQQRSYYQV